MESEEPRAQRKVRLPNPRMVVLLDGGLEEGFRETLPIDGVEGLLSTLRPRVELDLPPRLPLLGNLGRVALEIDSLAALTPDGVIARIPQLAEITRALAASRDAERGASAFDDLPEGVRDWLPSASGATRPAPSTEGEVSSRGESAETDDRPAGEGEGSRVDDILAMVEPTPGRESAPSLADAMGRWVSDSSAGSEERWIRAARQALEEKLSTILRAVLDHPGLRGLEAAWRGLDLLGRIAGRGGVEIEIVQATKESAPEVFFEEIFHREYDRRPEKPALGVLVAHTYHRTSQDLEDLDAFARFGESLRLPMITSIATDFWGIEKPRLLAGLPDLFGRFDGPELIKWRELRREDRASWLFFGVNRFASRAPWGGETSGRIRSFSWHGEPSEPLWNDTAWLLSAAVCRAHAQSGVRCQLTESEIEDLPLVEYATPRGASFGYPLEVRLKQDRIEDLARLGFVAPTAEEGSARIFFREAPSFFLPEVYHIDEASRASERAARLEQRVFAAQATHRVDRLAREWLEQGPDVDRAMEQLRASLLPFLEEIDEEDRQLSLELESSDESENGSVGRRQILIRLRPDYSVGGGPVDLVLAAPLDAIG